MDERHENPVSSPNPFQIVLSWDAVCERYAGRFRDQFQGKRKIHFDTLPDSLRTVDGAKAKWLFLVLLDAMIYFLRNEVPIDSARRYFHQQRELCDAVSAEIKAAFAKLRDEMMDEQELQSNRHYLGANVIVDVAVDTIPYPWDSFESFRSFHLKSTPTKAKQKYLAIVAHLTHHQTLAEFGFNIPVIINEVLAKVMA
eukprot:gene17554-12562_t